MAKKIQTAKKTGLGVKSKPKLRDFVRVCKCSNRVVCQIKNHGHIDILTVETGGYLFNVGTYYRYKKSYGTDQIRVSAQGNSYEVINSQTGFDCTKLNPSNEEFKRLLNEGVIKKFNKTDMKNRKTNLNGFYESIPLLLIRSTIPSKLNYIKCIQCDSKMMFKTFKELKHGNT